MKTLIAFVAGVALIVGFAFLFVLALLLSAPAPQDLAPVAVAPEVPVLQDVLPPREDKHAAVRKLRDDFIAGRPNRIDDLRADYDLMKAEQDKLLAEACAAGEMKPEYCN